MLRILIVALIAALLVLPGHASPTYRKGSKSSSGLAFDPQYVRSVSKSEIPTLHIMEINTIRHGLGNDSTTLTSPSSTGSLPDNSTENVILGSQQRDIIGGIDNRYLYIGGGVPYRQVGRITRSDGWYGSGFLVGPKLVMIAKHQLDMEQLSSYTFWPGYDNGVAHFGSYSVSDAYTNPYPSAEVETGDACAWQQDWAILVTNDRPGDLLGWFGTRTPDFSRMDHGILATLGYPQDRDDGRRPYRQDSIAAETKWESESTSWALCDDETYEPILTEMDCGLGQSGSPLWNNLEAEYLSWGVLSSFTSRYTVFAGGKAMVEQVKELLIQYP